MFPTLGVSGQRSFALNFAGRGKRGYLASSCASDAYVTSFTSNNVAARSCDGTFQGAQGGVSGILAYAQVDVFKAFRDGVWTSSTTIELYMGNTGAVDATAYNIRVASGAVAANGGATAGCPCVEKMATFQNVAANTCANLTDVKATITVYEDGSLSIA